MKVNLPVSLLGPVIVVALAGMSSDAGAVTQERVFATNPAGICQSALPVFDGVIRKRPKAVANEGTSNSFITCAFPSQGPDGVTDSPDNAIALVVYLSSQSGSPQNITCTAVPGWDSYTFIPAVTKTVEAGPSSAFSAISWLPEDFGEGRTTLPTSLIAISCNLPPSSAINDSYLYFNEDVGT